MRKLVVLIIISLLLFPCITGCEAGSDLPEYSLSFTSKQDMCLEMNGIQYSVQNGREWWPVEEYEDRPIGKCKYYDWYAYIYETSSPDCYFIKSTRKNRAPVDYLFRIDMDDLSTVSYDEIDEAYFERDKKEVIFDFNEVKGLLESTGEIERMNITDTEQKAAIYLRSKQKNGLETGIPIKYNKKSQEHYFLVGWLEDSVIEGINCESFYQKYSAKLEAMP